MVASVSPSVTIGIPVYNGERYLPIALASVQSQDYENLEILISDNASTDGTSQIAAEAALADSRIRYLRSDTNRGGVWNVNRLVGEARGDLFKWAYADDVILPAMISRCVAALNDFGPDAVMAHARTVTIDVTGDVIEQRDDGDLHLDLKRPHDRLHQLLARLANQTEFGLIRTSALRASSGALPMIGSEMVLLAELILMGPFIGVPEQLQQLRRHPEQYGSTRHTEGRWFGPAKQRGALLPFANISLALVEAVVRSKLPAAERARCIGTVLGHWTVPRRRAIASDLRYLPRTYRDQRLVRRSLKPL